MSGWRGYKSQEVPGGWKVVDGVLTKDGKSDDLVTNGGSEANHTTMWGLFALM